MNISRLSIKKYKSIIHEQILNPEATTIFIGKNNSGKTTYLDGIYRFFRPVQHSERYFDEEAYIEMSLRFDSKELSEIQPLDPIVKQSDITCILSKDAVSVKTDDERTTISQELSQWLIRHSIRISALRDLDYVKMQKLVEEFTSGWPKSYTIFLRTLQDFFPEIKAPKKIFFQKGNEFETRVKELGTQRNIERLGLGFQHLFILLLYFFHPRYQILLIDEPEIHQHPIMCKRLAKLFFENKPKKQVFISTHSSAFIQASHIQSVYRVVRDQKKGTYCVRGLSDANDSLRLTQELNDDTNEMFFADSVLLVEGISDRLFIRTVIDKFFPLHHDIKIVPVHGKENFMVYAKVLSAFHIPTHILCDADGKDVASKISSQLESTGFCWVHVLPHGTIESFFPHTPLEEGTPKPLQALKSAMRMEQKDLQSDTFLPLKNIIEKIIAPV